MKFSKVSQLLLVSMIGLLVASLLPGCALVTIDYVYLAGSSTSGGNGQIQAFAVDSQSGALRTGPAAADSGGRVRLSLRNPLDEATRGRGSLSLGTVIRGGRSELADYR